VYRDISLWEPTVEYFPVEPTVIAPEGAEVLLWAITAETRELTASKRRILNQSEVNANSY
jgi:hypothetical protein